MSETPKSKFSMWFNCQSENEQHKYWSVSEITVDEKNKVSGYGGKDCIKISAKMFPAQSQSGNPYMKMVVSDYQKQEKNEEEF